MSWWYLPIMFVVGAFFGMLLAALLMAGGGKRD